mgnify:CR=1 FL=1
MLTQNKDIADYFENLIKENTGGIEVKKLANWVINEFLSELKLLESKEIKTISAKNFLELITSVESGIINRNTGKTVLAEMLASGKTASEIIKEKNLAQVSDDKGIENQKEFSDLIGGKDKLFGFFVGEVMKKTKGKANPKKANEILRKYIEENK